MIDRSIWSVAGVAVFCVVVAPLALGTPAVVRSFPSGQGWKGPTAASNYEDWSFGNCNGAYLKDRAHLGADSQGSATGDKVKAMASGTVARVMDWGATWGKAISVVHETSAKERFIAVYGHVTPSVKAGKKVSAGTVIGSLHDQGTNSHLHLGIRPLGTDEAAAAAPVKGLTACDKKTYSKHGYVNPIPWLAARKPAAEGKKAPRDRKAPSAPGGLKASATESLIRLTWRASRDNVGVKGYRVYRSGSRVATTPKISFVFRGLGCGKSFTLSVEAYDAAGNKSARATVRAGTLRCKTPPPPRAILVSAGWAHTCAVTSAGAAKCWGGNLSGELGDGRDLDAVCEEEACQDSESRIPISVVGLQSGVKAIAAGGEHTCALTTGGAVKCWGSNLRGQLGNAQGGDTCEENCQSSTPVDVSGLQSGVKAIAAGGEHTCALTVAGAIKCWGYNGYGQLGDGTDLEACEGYCTRPTPADVAGLQSGVKAIAAGLNHTCAVTAVDGIQCWGSDASGQLGDGEDAEDCEDCAGMRSTPVGVVGLQSGVAAIAVGDEHTCAVTSTGAAKCWGSNGIGQLGDGSDLSDECETCAVGSGTPVNVLGLERGVKEIAAGSSHTCALTASGGVKCWGSNVNGQLGNGSGGNDCGEEDICASSRPVNVSGPQSGFAEITAGGDHACASIAGGGLKCWGANWSGQLGNNQDTDSSVPVDVAGLTVKARLLMASATSGSERN